MKTESIVSSSDAWNKAALTATVFLGAATALFLLALWFSHDPAANFVANLPGTDGRPPGMGTSSETVNLQGVFQQFDGIASDLSGAWSRFRGPDFDNICKDGTALADSWGENGPAILWSVGLGEGHAAPVVLNGGCICSITTKQSGLTLYDVSRWPTAKKYGAGSTLFK